MGCCRGAASRQLGRGVERQRLPRHGVQPGDVEASQLHAELESCRLLAAAGKGLIHCDTGSLSRAKFSPRRAYGICGFTLHGRCREHIMGAPYLIISTCMHMHTCMRMSRVHVHLHVHAFWVSRTAKEILPAYQGCVPCGMCAN